MSEDWGWRQQGQDDARNTGFSPDLWAEVGVERAAEAAARVAESGEGASLEIGDGTGRRVEFGRGLRGDGVVVTLLDETGWCWN